MFERVPYILEILTVVVVVECYFVFWWYRHCCKKAREAWDGVDALTDWINDTLIPALKLKFQDCGCPADPTWPPEDPPEFPPGEEEE